ncbi:MAG: hypothetical protein LBQ90_12015 [Synergistaceae bacterium]|nr:hypothetical protein [Synergistaceae bacterium]
MNVTISLCLLAVFLLTAFFILTHTDHDCGGDDCPVCAHIHDCSRTLRRFGLSRALPGAFVVLLPLFLHPPAVFFPIGEKTPAGIKVRLNN